MTSSSNGDQIPWTNYWGPVFRVRARRQLQGMTCIEVGRPSPSGNTRPTGFTNFYRACSQTRALVLCVVLEGSLPAGRELAAGFGRLVVPLGWGWRYPTETQQLPGAGVVGPEIDQLRPVHADHRPIWPRGRVSSCVA